MDQQATEQLQFLLKQAESLSAEQQMLQQKISGLVAEIRALQASVYPAGTPAPTAASPVVPPPTPATLPMAPSGFVRISPEAQEKPAAVLPEVKYKPSGPSLAEKWLKAIGGNNADFEKFIGENIISKIGIIITVVGVAIGTKYAIDKDLLSPLTRVLLGYLLGLGILVFAMRFRKKYEGFSAILVSGAMAIFYLITFAAYSFYGLIPQPLAFGLMVAFTLFTVSASLLYNRQWIALFGLAGAYGVPFLVSTNSGKVELLLAYMALLNLGILAVAYKKYWRLLYYAAFAISWIIFLTWFGTRFKAEQHFAVATGFSTVFFLTFYGIFMLHKLAEKRKFEPADIILLLANSFIYFGIGYAAFAGYPPAEKFSGLFTLCNAIIHFGVAALIFRMKLADRNLFYLVSGLVLVFITIAIPVQLNGQWVTLTWAAEAALLYRIGRSRQTGFYELLSYPLMVLALLSQVQDWDGLATPSLYFEGAERIGPIFNAAFPAALLVCAAFGFMMITGKKYQTVLLNPRLDSPQPYAQFFGNILPPAAFIFLLFLTFRQELVQLWAERYSRPVNTGDEFTYYPTSTAPYLLLRIWLFNYTAFFMGLWGLALLRFRPSEKRTLFIYMGISAFVLLLMATMNIFLTGSLRDSVLNPEPGMPGVARSTALSIRYIGYACAAFLLVVLYRLKMQTTDNPKWLLIAFDLLLHLNLVCAGSSELITWLKLYEYAGFDKLGLSIFWGIYSLVLIGLGISQKKQHLRIGAIILFAITLLKLFFYDMATMNTMAKTIVFISLGILLLTISFLYNRYKNAIGEPHEK